MSMISPEPQQFSGPTATQSAGPHSAPMKSGAEANTVAQLLAAKQAAAGGAGATAGLSAVSSSLVRMPATVTAAPAMAPKAIAGQAGAPSPAPAAAASTATAKGSGAKQITFDFTMTRTVANGLGSLSADPRDAVTTHDITCYTKGAVKPGQKVFIMGVDITQASCSSAARMGVVVANLPGTMPEALPGGKTANYHHVELRPMGSEMSAPVRIFDASQDTVVNSALNQGHMERYGATQFTTAEQLMSQVSAPNANGKVEVFEGTEIAKAFDKPSSKPGFTSRAHEFGLTYQQASHGPKAGQRYYQVGAELAQTTAALISEKVLQSEAFTKHRTTLDNVSLTLVPLGEHQKFTIPELQNSPSHVKTEEHARSIQVVVKGKMTAMVMQ